MRDDLIGVLLGCGCMAACCCDTRAPAATPGGNLFLQRHGPAHPAPLLDESPFVPTLPITFAPLPHLGAWMPAAAGFNRYLPRHFGGPLDNRTPHGSGARIGPWVPGDTMTAGPTYSPDQEATYTSGTVLASALVGASGLMELWLVSDPTGPSDGTEHLRLVTWSVLGGGTSVEPLAIPAPVFIDSDPDHTPEFVIPDSGSEVRSFFWIGTSGDTVRMIETLTKVEDREGVLVPVESTRIINVGGGGVDITDVGLVGTPFPSGTYVKVLADGWLDGDPAQLVLYFQASGDTAQRLALIKWTGSGWAIATERLFPDAEDSASFPYTSDLTFSTDSIDGPPWQTLNGTPAGTVSAPSLILNTELEPGAAASVRVPVRLVSGEVPGVRVGDVVNADGHPLIVTGVSAQTVSLTPDDLGWPAKLRAGEAYPVTRQRPVQSDGVGGGTLHLFPFHNVPVRLRPVSGTGWGYAPGPVVNPDLRSSGVRHQIARSVNGEALGLSFEAMPAGPVDLTPTLLLTYRVKATIILTVHSTVPLFEIPFQLEPSGRGWAQARVPLPTPRAPPGPGSYALTLTVPDGSDLRLSSAVIDAAPTAGDP